MTTQKITRRWLQSWRVPHLPRSQFGERHHAFPTACAPVEANWNPEPTANGKASAHQSDCWFHHGSPGLLFLSYLVAGQHTPLKSLKPNWSSFELRNHLFRSEWDNQLLAGARFVHVCCTTEPGCTGRTAGCPTFPRLASASTASTRRIRIRTAKTVKSEHLHAFASPFFSTIRLFLSLGPGLKEECGAKTAERMRRKTTKCRQSNSDQNP
jgi:hypothetical protein